MPVSLSSFGHTQVIMHMISDRVNSVLGLITCQTINLGWSWSSNRRGVIIIVTNLIRPHRYDISKEWASVEALSWGQVNAVASSAIVRIHEIAVRNVPRAGLRLCRTTVPLTVINRSTHTDESLFDHWPMLMWKNARTKLTVLFRALGWEFIRKRKGKERKGIPSFLKKRRNLRNYLDSLAAQNVPNHKKVGIVKFFRNQWQRSSSVPEFSPLFPIQRNSLGTEEQWNRGSLSPFLKKILGSVCIIFH